MDTNILEQQLCLNERRLVKAERDFEIYSTAPFAIIWATLIAILGFIPSFLKEIQDEWGVYWFGGIILFGIVGLSFFLYAAYLRKQVLDDLVDLRINKIHLEQALSKIERNGQN